jgi:asparagine N-glycosylation enzyme membrane subunit Stt3
VAPTDPYLDHPHGAAIPWPPYYDALLALCLGPLAGGAPSAADELAWRSFLERGVATVPAVLGVGTALFAALLAFRLTRGGPLAARAAGALAAGLTVATARAAINYSVVGNGDHHAWIDFLHGLLLLLVTSAACRSNLRSRRRSLAFGLAAGLVAGAMLGSWVASLLYVANVELALAWLLYRRGEEELPGVAALGLGFHGAALAAVLPAVVASPWRAEFPWMAVNLSWLHPALLALGALAFAPPFLGERGRLAPRTAAARAYPWLAAAALALGAGALWVLGAPPARGLAEGFAWVSRADAFMDTVLESAPLVGPRAGSWHAPFTEALGWGLLLLPLAYVPLLRAAFRSRRDVLVPLAVALPLLVVQALAQRRFADPLALPMAACLGWAVARLAARARSGQALWIPAAALAALALQWPSLERTWTQRRGLPAAGGPHDVRLAERLACEWLRRREGEGAVLSHWDRGHLIEWAADRPTVATNFGSYVGIESYRDPARFFLAEESLAGRAILEARRARYVLVPGSLPGMVESLVRIADPTLDGLYLVDTGAGRVTSPRWLSTLGARLLNGGEQLAPPGTPPEDLSPPIGFLRLVHVSREREPAYRDPVTEELLPAVFVWEHVPGAALAIRGAPEELARADLTLRYPEADYGMDLVFTARCDVTGVARLWIPYATDAPNGDGQVVRAQWSCGARSGELSIPTSAVMGGPALEIR